MHCTKKRIKVKNVLFFHRTIWYPFTQRLEGKKLFIRITYGFFSHEFSLHYEQVEESKNESSMTGYHHLTSISRQYYWFLRPHCSQSTHFQYSLLTGTLMKAIFLYFIILSLMRKQFLQRFLLCFWLKHILLNVSDLPKTQTVLLTVMVFNNMNHICSFLLFSCAFPLFLLKTWPFRVNDVSVYVNIQ